MISHRSLQNRKSCVKQKITKTLKKIRCTVEQHGRKLGAAIPGCAGTKSQLVPLFTENEFMKLKRLQTFLRARVRGHSNFEITLLFVLSSPILQILYYYLSGCLQDTGATFAPGRVHSGSLSWLQICLHDTTTKCHAGASRPGVS